MTCVMAMPQPIPLEELKTMMGEPVWIEYPALGSSGWQIVSLATFCMLGGYGETCAAYRSKPVNYEVKMK